jgi:SpoVK/Ycf46/Vps4 family AAA+-type ATPase
VTLENIRVLRTIRSLIRRINRHDLLRRSGLTVNWKPLRWSDLLPTDLSAPSGKQIKNQLETLLVNPIKRGKSVDTRSAVFYGPPGTSKTSIAEALADALSERGRRWLFVTITPGDFIAGGEAMAEINADNIFRILNELPNVVILFDEIDQLLGDRDNRENRSGGALQFMTTSMLTKFQKLRQRKINVFVLTTNKFEKLDSAIRRAGRFDQHVAVMPPDAPSRVAILKKLLKKFDKERNMDFLRRLKNRGLLEVANRTCLFTYPELQALLSDVLPFLPAATEGKEIQKELIDKAANYSRATSFASYMNERRLGADKEIAILLSTISEAEFKLFTTEDRENFVSLAKTVQASEFKSKLPGWVLSPGVIGELSTPRRDIRST